MVYLSFVRKSFSAVSSAFLFFFAATTNAFAAFISIDAVDYGTANDDDPIGSFDRLSTNLEAASTGNSIHRGLIEFDLAGVSGTVTSATLVLRNNSGTNPPNDVQFHGYSGDGTISLSDALVSNLITTVNIPVYPSAPTDENLRIDVDVTSFVQTLPSYAGFMLRMPDETLDHGQRFNPTFGPSLEVQFTAPVP